MAVLVSLRSWPGLVALCQPDTAALKSLVALLYPNHEDTRVRRQRDKIFVKSVQGNFAKCD